MSEDISQEEVDEENAKLLETDTSSVALSSPEPKVMGDVPTVEQGKCLDLGVTLILG